MQGKVGQQQGWALCAGLGQQGPLKGFKQGACYKAHSSWEEAIIPEKREAEANKAATVWFKC